MDENDNVVDGWKISDKKAKSGLAGTPDFASVILDNLKLAGVQQAHKEDRITFTSLTGWPGKFICAEGRFEASDEWLVVSGSAQSTSHQPLAVRRAAIRIGRNSAPSPAPTSSPQRVKQRTPISTSSSPAPSTTTPTPPNSRSSAAFRC